MAGEVLGTASQLQVTIPLALETDWATSIRDNCFQKIVEHDHTGTSGMGVAIATAALEADAVTGAKILLDRDWETIISYGCSPICFES